MRGGGRPAGFRTLSLLATLPGVPLYLAYGFLRSEEVEVLLPDGLALPCVAMTKALPARPAETRDLDAVVRCDEPVPAADLLDPVAEPALLDLDDAVAARAREMVVMPSLQRR